MQELLEQALEACFKGIYGEGRRLVKLKTFSVLLQVVQGIRRAVILQYVMMSFCFLWALSFFAFGWLMTDNWDAVRDLHPPHALVFALCVWAVSTGVLAVTVSQKIWVKALGVQERVDEMTRETDPPPPSGLSEREISALVDKLVDRKLKAHDRSAS